MSRWRVGAKLLVVFVAVCHGDAWAGVSGATDPRTPSARAVVRPAIEHGYIEVQYSVYAEDALAGSGRPVTVRLPLCNQVEPMFRVRVGRQAGYLLYQYELANGVRAKQPIQSFDLILPPDAVIGGVRSPKGWQHGVILSRVSTVRHALVDRGEGKVLSWYKAGGDTQPLPGGPGMSGFVLPIEHLPGITYAYVFAPHTREYHTVLANLPSEASKAVVRFLNAESLARPVLLIGPKFHPSTPKSEIVSDFLMRLRRPEDRLATLLGEGFHSAALSLLSRYKESLTDESSFMQAQGALRVFLQRTCGSEIERELCRALDLSLCPVNEALR